MTGLACARNGGVFENRNVAALWEFAVAQAAGQHWIGLLLSNRSFSDLNDRYGITAIIRSHTTFSAVSGRGRDRSALHRAGRSCPRFLRRSRWNGNGGKPIQNDTVESFNGRMRDELLGEPLFTSLAHAREAVAAWADDCNAVRPYSALGCATPAAYAAGLRLAAPRQVATVAREGDDTRRSLVATG